MKEGNLNAVLKEANSAGLAIAQRTANERLDRMVTVMMTMLTT